MAEQDVNTQESFGQILNVEATMTLTITKDSAVADGADMDIAHVNFDNVDDSITDVRIDYTIVSGNAVFQENQKQTISKHTNQMLSSTVNIIDFTAETGKIKAAPYFNPTAAPPSVDYTFMAPPRKLKLDLTVNPDNQFADGVAADGVIATLTDDKNQPAVNETLNFSLVDGSSAQFTTGGTKASLSTGSNGKVTVWISDKVNADVTVSVTCTLASDPSVTKTIDIHFRVKPSIADFRLLGLSTKGIVNNVRPGQVRAIITPSLGSPAAGYIVHFSKYGLGTIPYFLGTFTLPGVSDGKTGQPEFDYPVNVSGVTTTDIWVHDLDLKADYTNIQAELKTSDGKHVAYSEISSNPRIDFILQTPPPPPPPSAAIPKLRVSYKIWASDGQHPSKYACILVVEAINGYNTPGTLTITSETSALNFAEAIGGARPPLHTSCPFSMNFYNRGHGELYAQDPNLNNSSDSPRFFNISDGGNIIWRGYLTFLSMNVVDKTIY